MISCYVYLIIIHSILRIIAEFKTYRLSVVWVREWEIGVIQVIYRKRLNVRLQNKQLYD